MEILIWCTVLIVTEPERERSNWFKLNLRFIKDIRKNWLTNRVADEWTRLGSYFVSVNTIDTFKKLDDFMDSEGRLS